MELTIHRKPAFKFIVFFLLAIPAYVVFNTLILNLLICLVDQPFRALEFGSYCAFRKHQYDLPPGYPFGSMMFINLGFIFIRLVLFSFVYLKGKRAPIVHRFLQALFVMDVLGLFLFLAFVNNFVDLFNLYFSFSTLFLFSAHLFSLPILLPMALVLGEFLFLRARPIEAKKLVLLFFLALLSAVLWISLRSLLFAIT